MKLFIQKCRTDSRPFMNFSVMQIMLTLLVSFIPLNAKAVSPNTQFQQYITYICGLAPPFPADWDIASISAMCADAASGFVGQSGPVSANLGTANASSTVARQTQGIQDRLEERKEEADKAASADDGGWGLLLSPQYGKSKRPETELENGFQSELKGLVLGLDYRFSDSFVLGTAIGHTKDDAAFLNNAGYLKTANNTFTMYSTWAPSDSAYVDGYLGAGKMDYQSQRQVIFGLISGTTTGDMSGNQIMAGLSAGYKMYVSNVSFEPFVNFDYIKTKIKGYNESGNTGLELHYNDRNSVSTTSSLGGRASVAFGYNWGTLLPSIRLAAVHEYKSDSQQIGNELVTAPGTSFLVATDNPDRNFLLTGLGLAAAFNGGTQAFVNYENRSKDKLLNSWAVSVGVLAEF